MRMIAAILLILMTFQVMCRGIVFSSYLNNKAYIAAVLCENKDKPELECEGKCYLKKQLQKTDAPDSNTSGLTLKLEISPFMAPAIVWDEAAVAMSESMAFNATSENSYRYSYHPACFHPPRV